MSNYESVCPEAPDRLKLNNPEKDGGDGISTDTEQSGETRLTLHSLARKLGEIDYRLARLERAWYGRNVD